MTAADDVWEEVDRLPHDTDAEMSVIGALLITGRPLTDVLTTVKAEDFYRPAHEAIYRAVLALADDGAPNDTRMVFDRMTKDGTLTQAGGAAYLHTCEQSTPSAANAGFYARIVRERAVLRRVIQAGHRITQMGYAADGGDAATIAGAALAELESVVSAAAAQGEASWAALTDIWPAVVEETRRRSDPTAPDDGIRWGYRDVDSELAPMRPGDLVVVTAYSGGGKSIVVGNLAFEASQYQGKRALVHALEMSRLELGQRWASWLHEINLGRIARGQLHASEAVMVEETHLLTQNADNLIVDDSPYLSLPQLRASIRAHKPDLVVVDQLPLMTPPDARVSREQQMTALAYGLKQLAKDEHVVIVAAAQLNADATKRKSPEPTLHDLRESKAIAHAANWVVALHDPTGGEREHPQIGEVDWLVLKARQGKNGQRVQLVNQYVYAHLADWRE